MTKQLTTTDFIRKARVVHGATYDYANIIYVNTVTKLEIICVKHGSFWQTPNNHISGGTGCPSCAKRHSGVTALSTLTQFIHKANHAHNGRYKYSKTVYINSRTKLEITCDEHGSFWQTPNGHLYDVNGCPKCYYQNKGSVS